MGKKDVAIAAQSTAIPDGRDAAFPKPIMLLNTSFGHLTDSIKCEKDFIPMKALNDSL